MSNKTQPRRYSVIALIVALIAVIATIVGCAPTFSALAAAVCDEVGATVPAYVTPVDGEMLYAAADALDIAVLAALGAR